MTPGPKSLVIKVEIQNMDTAKVKIGPALIDSGATSSFMSWSYVERNCLNTQKLTQLIDVHKVDSSLNKDGSVTEIINAILHVNGHSKRTTFTVTNFGKLDIILGFTWLAEHNPEINWQTHKVTLSRCLDKYHKHRTEIQEENKALWKSTKWIHICRQGPFTSLADDEPMPEFNSETLEFVKSIRPGTYSNEWLR